MILIFMVFFCISSIGVQAATITKTRTLKSTYHDSIITSWKVGVIKSTYTYSYNNITNKLVDQKSITHSTSNIAIGCGFKDINKKWSWYDTSQQNGTGKGITSWTFGMGLSTQWVDLGYFQDNWMALTVKGNGTNVASYSS